MAKKTGYLISEEDYRIFQKLIARERAREQVPRNRPVSYVPGLDHTAPEIYIAKPKTSIAALASAKPGEGLFEAYQIQDNSEGDPELFSVGGLEKLGFNLSSSALSTSTYYILVRDKFGNWFPVVGGSTPLEVRSFVLRTSLSPGGYAVAQQLSYKTLGTCSSETGTGTGTGIDPDAKRLCYTKDGNGEDVFFIVYDRLGEFAGWADAESETYSCGIAYKLPDTPTFDELCLYPEFFPEEYAEVNDVWEIMRMVCTNFYGCPCQTLDCEEDIYGQL
jgi:hypothetical protein